MRIFLDTANIDDIRRGAAMGVVDGVTTNPTLVAKEGVEYKARVLEICRKVGAAAYYSGVMGKTYLDRDAFRQAGVEIVFQSFEHPTYDQLFMKPQGFVPNLSALDLLFNCGSKGLELIGQPDSRALAGFAN